MLWVKSGRVVWSQSQTRTGNDKQSFPTKQGFLTQYSVSPLLGKGHTSIDQGELERGSACFLFQIYYGCQSECFQIGYCKKQRYCWTEPLSLCTWSQRASRIPKHFRNSKEDVWQCAIEKPLNKDCMESRKNVPKIQHLLTSHVLEHHHLQCIVLKKQHTKKNKVASE